MNSKILIVPDVPTTPEIAITSEGVKTKGQLIIRSAAITKVTTIKHRDDAIVTAATIKTHLKSVETNRQEILKPFHKVVADINTAARNHVKELDSELKRVNGMVGQFEVNRQNDEYLAKKKAADELAEASRKAEEAVQAAPTPAKALEAALDAEERVGAATEKVDEVLATQGANKATGGALRKDWDITVTDIKALYAAHPQCVKMEVSLLAVKDLLKAGITPPGITAIKKTTYSARGKK